MIVMKFGGTSVGDGARIRRLAERVREREDRRPVVVVSALAGTTDRLETALRCAASGRVEAVEPVLAELSRAHRWALRGAVDGSERRHDLTVAFDRDLDELRELLRSVRVLGEWTARARDAVLAYGERGAARLVEAALVEHGVPAQGFDPVEVLRTDDRHGAASPDLEATRRATRTLAEASGEGRVPVVGGFVARGRDGAPTTLGRGGSDTTAAVLGCVLDAEEIQIWTDVDGILTADPRRCPGARRLPRVSFRFAAELASHGAEVLHPGALSPAVRRGIPITVRNAFEPDDPGTRVESDPDPESDAIALACREPVVAWRLLDRTLDASHAWAVRVAWASLSPAPFVILASGYGAVLAFDRAPDVVPDDVVDAGCTVETLDERAWIGVVREGRSRGPALDGALERELQPDAWTSGASGGLGILLPRERLNAALGRLHAAWVPAGA